MADSSGGLVGFRPYLVQALYDWLVDSGATPHVLVDTHWPGCDLPPIPVGPDGQLVFNLAPQAVHQLHISPEGLVFQARFSGRPHAVAVPMGALLGLYARETGAGLTFDPQEYPRPDPETPPPAGPAPDAPSSRPALRVVK